MDLRIGSKYVLKKRIGAGSFGEIYTGEHITSHEEVAVKLESVHTRPPQLQNEYRAYKGLAGGVGIPAVKWFGIEGDYNVLVMDLLGKSIEELLHQCHGKLSLKTVLMLADQMLARIEYLHNRNLLHRDIKPDNFVIGGTPETENILYVIDLGLSKKFRDPKTRQHIPFREGKALTGTARYASINTHIGIEQSRRDDLEGIAYVLIYLLKGTLPWMGIKMENRKQKYEAISDRKMATPIDVICQDIPKEFAVFLSEVRKLDFQDRPDYSLYRDMFRTLFVREGYVYDYKYDWCELPNTQASPSLVVEEATPAQTPASPAVQAPPAPHPLIDIQKITPSTPVFPVMQTHTAIVRRPVPKIFLAGGKGCPVARPGVPRRAGVANWASPTSAKQTHRSAQNRL